MRPIILLIALLGFTKLQAQDPAVILEVEEVSISAEALDAIATELDNPSCYRVYASFPDNYELQFIYGLLDTPIDITASGGFYQDPLGGGSTLIINPDVYPVQPTLPFDSWLTIGDEDNVGNEMEVLPDGIIFDAWEAGSNQLLIDGPFGGGVYITTESAIEQNTPDETGRVLIGQFTFSGELNGMLSLQIRRLNPDGSIFDPPGPALAETFVAENLTFSAQSSAPCLGDFDSDGVVGVADLLNVLSEFGCVSNCAFDLDNDGYVFVSDILVMLSVIGDQCED